MASIIKHNNGWRALINKKGIRKSKTFNNKTAAKEWASKLEYQINNSDVIINKKTLHELLIKYRDTISIKKRSARFETNKINHILTTLSRSTFANTRSFDLSEKPEASISELI